MQTVQTASEPTTNRATAWGGIVAAVLYTAGILVMLGGTPSDKHHDQPVKYAADWHRYYADGDKRTLALIGVYVLVLAALAMVVFGSHLRDRLAASGATGAGRLAFAGSIIFAALTMVGGLAFAWIPGSVAFGSTPVPTGEILWLAPQLAFGFLLVGAMAGAAFMLITAGARGARTGALPGWLGWSGVVVGVIVFAIGAFFMPLLLLVLWTLVAGVVCLRRPVGAEPSAVGIS